MKFYSLADRNLKEIYRDPVSTLLGLGMPIAFLVVFASIEKKLPLELYTPQMLTPGIMVFSFTFLIMFSSMLLSKDRQTSFLIRLFTTPLKPSDYILSYTLPFLPLALAQTVVCLIAGTILGASFSNIFVCILLLLLFSTICISLGVILGSFLTVNQVSGIGSLLITIIAFISGAWVDLKMIGGTLKTIAYALPFAHAVDASRALLSGSGFADMANSLVIISVYAVAFFLLAVLAFRKAMKKI